MNDINPAAIRVLYRFSPGVYNVVVTVGGKCSATGTTSCPAYGSAYGIDAR